MIRRAGCSSSRTAGSWRPSTSSNPRWGADRSISPPTPPAADYRSHGFKVRFETSQPGLDQATALRIPHSRERHRVHAAGPSPSTSRRARTRLNWDGIPGRQRQKRNCGVTIGQTGILASRPGHRRLMACRSACSTPTSEATNQGTQPKWTLRCSSLVDWPVYPRLKRIMAGSAWARKPWAACGCAP
jgi:hypothetical protein